MCLWHISGEEVAIKVLDSAHEMIEEIEEEYQILRDFSEHPNMPRFYGMYLKHASEYDSQVWLVMEVRTVYVFCLLLLCGFFGGEVVIFIQDIEKG